MPEDPDPEADRRNLREMVEDLQRRVARLEEMVEPEELDPLKVGTVLFREASKVKAGVIGRK